jgi:hypothetical protein
MAARGRRAARPSVEWEPPPRQGAGTLHGLRRQQPHRLARGGDRGIGRRTVHHDDRRAGQRVQVLDGQRPTIALDLFRPGDT